MMRKSCFFNKVKEEILQDSFLNSKTNVIKNVMVIPKTREIIINYNKLNDELLYSTTERERLEVMVDNLSNNKWKIESYIGPEYCRRAYSVLKLKQINNYYKKITEIVMTLVTALVILYRPIWLKILSQSVFYKPCKQLSYFWTLGVVSYFLILLLKSIYRKKWQGICYYLLLLILICISPIILFFVVYYISN